MRLEESLRGLRAPDTAEGERLDALAARARALVDRVRAAAVRVRVELEAGAVLEVTPELELDPERGEYLVASPARFRIPGAGAIEVRGADEALETWLREAREAAVELRRAVEHFGVADLGELTQRRRQRGACEAELATIRSRLQEADAGAPSRERRAGDRSSSSGPSEVEVQRLEEVRSELKDLRARAPQAVLPGIEGWAEHRTLEQIRELEERARALERRMREERDAEQDADRRYRLHHDDLLRLGQRAAATQAEVATLRTALAEEVQQHGDVAGLDTAVAAVQTDLVRLRAELHARRDDVEREIAAPRRRRVAIETELRRLESDLRAVDAGRADRLARIEEAAAFDLDGRVDDLEGRLAVARRRLEVVERRSGAARLLQRLVDYHHDRRARELVAPVAELVDRWLQHVTGRRYRGLALDDKLVPLEVRPARYHEALPLESLSYGTYEQVVVLLRLALGALLSREERQLVILDDRLVNADAERLERFCEVLAEVASSCQVLLATCDEAPFRRLGAKVCRMDGEAVGTAVDSRHAGSGGSEA